VAPLQQALADGRPQQAGAQQGDRAGAGGFECLRISLPARGPEIAGEIGR
jgi:hypothetical protein